LCNSSWKHSLVCAFSAILCARPAPIHPANAATAAALEKRISRQISGETRVERSKGSTRYSSVVQEVVGARIVDDAQSEFVETKKWPQLGASSTPQSVTLKFYGDQTTNDGRAWREIPLFGGSGRERLSFLTSTSLCPHFAPEDMLIRSGSSSPSVPVWHPWTSLPHRYLRLIFSPRVSIMMPPKKQSTSACIARPISSPHRLPRCAKSPLCSSLVLLLV
jgi:hypothetical protein